jgi:hypothetical protein
VVSDDPRETFARNLDLPRGSSRERVRANDKEYRLSGEDVRALATVGAFRVVPASDLREPNPRTPTRPARGLERLRDLGLVHTTPYVVGRTRTILVTLTGDGRDVLEGGRRPGTADRQAFYVGITKHRELAHDSKVYRAYMKAVERLAERGEPVRRVVLEEELKRESQRFLQGDNRGRRDVRLHVSVRRSVPSLEGRRSRTQTWRPGPGSERGFLRPGAVHAPPNGRDADYVEAGLDTGVCYNPLHNELDPYAVAYAVATLLNNLFRRSKKPFWQQAYTDLPKFVILMRRISDG